MEWLLHKCQAHGDSLKSTFDAEYDMETMKDFIPRSDCHSAIEKK